MASEKTHQSSEHISDGHVCRDFRVFRHFFAQVLVELPTQSRRESSALQSTRRRMLVISAPVHAEKELDVGEDCVDISIGQDIGHAQRRHEKLRRVQGERGLSKACARVLLEEVCVR